jgi:3-oxoacyl-[acyl-carrier-protein] synthase II
MRSVAITGIGLLTGLGTGRQETWKRLLDGDTAIRPVTAYDPSSFRTRLAAEIDDFQPERFAPRRSLRMATRNDQFAIAGAVLAVEDSGIDFDTCDPGRVGVFVGGNKEISNPDHMLAGALAGRREDGVADVRQLGRRYSSAFYPLYYVEGLQAASLFYISQRYGLTGPNAYFHGTADAGATAIGRAFRSISRGESQVAIAGGFDDAASWWTASKMDGLGVLSTDNDRLAEAFRPYDVDRSGSLLGDGAAFVVLEDAELARRRGAHVYAEITGVAATFDGRLLTPEPTGEPLAAAITKARAQAGAEIDFVATHGCATRLGDVSEARALRSALGSGACATSVKPATGHLVAAAGALNVVVCALAIDAGAVPPTLNLDRPDPDCDFDWVAGQARQLRVRNAIAIGRGLEGQQVAVALGAPGETRGAS